MDPPPDPEQPAHKRLRLDTSPPPNPASPVAHDTPTPLTHARISALQTVSTTTSNPTSPASASEDLAPSSPLPHPATPDADPDSDPNAPQEPDPHRTSPNLHYRPQFLLRGHKRAISCVKFSPNGRFIASASADATLRIWDATSGKKIHVCKGHLAGLSTLAWSSDSETIATGSDDKNIRIWDAVTGKAHPKPLTGHHNYVYSLAFSPKGNMLVSGSYDEAVIIWDVRGGRPLRSLPAHSDPVSGVDFVRDGTLITSCSTDGLLRVWDTASGQCLKTIYHEDRPGLSSVQFVPNGRYILTWSLDNCIRIWDYRDGRCAKTYKGHVNSQFSISGCTGLYTTRKLVKRRVQRRAVQETDDDMEDTEDEEKQENGDEMVEVEEEQDVIAAFLASGSEDGQIVLWDVVSKEIMQRLTGHEGVVFGVDSHPTEKRLASCGADKTIRVWTAEPQKSVSEAEAAGADADTEMQDLVKEVEAKSEPRAADVEGDHEMGGV